MEKNFLHINHKIDNSSQKKKKLFQANQKILNEIYNYQCSRKLFFNRIKKKKAPPLIAKSTTLKVTIFIGNMDYK